MWSCLNDALRRREIPFYLDEDVNHLDTLAEKVLKEYTDKAAQILGQLRRLQNQGTVDVKEVKELFLGETRFF